MWDVYFSSISCTDDIYEYVGDYYVLRVIMEKKQKINKYENRAAVTFKPC